MPNRRQSQHQSQYGEDPRELHNAKLDVSNRTQAGVVGLRIFAFTAALTG